MNRYNVRNIRIDPKKFQHPVDLTATEMITSQDAFSKALNFISENSLERQILCIYRSSMAQLTAKTAPEIYRMVDEACEMFEVTIKPEIYIYRDYSTSVTMLGIQHPMILISTELLKQLNEDELWGIIASEIAGIRNGFCEIRFVEWLCGSTGLLPFSVAKPLSKLFENWHKYLQFSYDRANLIATGDFNVTMRSILAGEAPKHILDKIDFRDPNCDYMKQTREFLEKTGHWTEKVRDYNAIAKAGVFYAARYMNLFQFLQTDYFDLVEDYLEVE